MPHAGHQPVDFLVGVVDRERCARGGGEAEAAVQRQRAVMADPYRHPVVVEHLRKLPGFGRFVFPWPHYKTTLYLDFAEIQRVAKINLTCARKHEHTPACHVYGFHDLRRAFATMNADRLTPDALQALMRHKSYSTTQLYINMARQMDAAVASLHVPEVLKKGMG